MDLLIAWLPPLPAGRQLIPRAASLVRQLSCSNNGHLFIGFHNLFHDKGFWHDAP